MHRSIHLRGLVVVGLVVAFALLAMGQVFAANPEVGTGQFTIITGEHNLGQPVAYVLDTTTGEVWSRALDGEVFFAAKRTEVGGPHALRPVQ